jgi:hypothetical protein
MGIGATREMDRVLASVGELQQAEPLFVAADNVCNAGVLFILPALVAQGLLKGMEVYGSIKKGYYGLLSILLLLSFMMLSRIKTPEQLKNCKPGELGKVLGLDRVPEVRCLRNKIKQIVAYKKAKEFNHAVSEVWIGEQDKEAMFFYVDGHVRVYHGNKATLSKRYVSREKLCLAGTTDYWINNEFGLPYLVITGELNEKLQSVIVNEVVPRLLRDTEKRVSTAALEKDPTLARFVLVFDREAYDQAFFKKLWQQYRIAIITYRKNVKDSWDENGFKACEATVIGKTVSMMLEERELESGDFTVREIRKLTEYGHQTSLLTTMKQGSMEFIAGKMFSRWSQENFFQYMMHNYDIDRLTEYGIEVVDPEKVVVNPSHRKNEYTLKKNREKLARVKARFFNIVEKNMDKSIDDLKGALEKESKLQETMRLLEKDIAVCLERRKDIASHIQIKDMEAGSQYNKLKTESRLFMNVLRMIAYRAETSIVNLLGEWYSRTEDEGRMLVKEIIKTDADLKPDYESKTLTVSLHSLSTPRANRVVERLCELLNETETVFPGTDLRLIYKTLSDDDNHTGLLLPAGLDCCDIPFVNK